MKFRIFRTSSQYGDGAVSPCLGATQEQDDKGVWAWFLEVNDLDALLRLSHDEGRLIVNSFPSIEIYDDYRE